MILFVCIFETTVSSVLYEVNIEFSLLTVRLRGDSLLLKYILALPAITVCNDSIVIISFVTEALYVEYVI